jgi:hypothetical protein
MIAFDPSGAIREGVKHDLRMQYYNLAMDEARTLLCNTGKDFREGYITVTGHSLFPMISDFTMRTWYEITIFKDCTNTSCCKSLNAIVHLRYFAYDRTDFNPGDCFWIPPNFIIYDQLVIDCNLGTPFYISAHDDDKDYWELECSGNAH